jgi:hypothetical protein
MGQIACPVGAPHVPVLVMERSATTVCKFFWRVIRTAVLSVEDPFIFYYEVPPTHLRPFAKGVEHVTFPEFA